MGLPHPEGDDLRHRLGAVLNAPEGEPREQVIGDPRRQGVDGHDPPGEAGAVLRLKDRVGHAPAGGQALHHAIEDIALPWDQGIFHIALVEERELHGAAGVHYPRLGQLQPLADIGAAGGLGHHGGHAHRELHRGRGNGIALQPVLIVPGKIAQQILHRGQAQLLQPGRPRLPDPGQFPQAGTQGQFHTDPSSPRAISFSLPQIIGQRQGRPRPGETLVVFPKGFFLSERNPVSSAKDAILT